MSKASLWKEVRRVGKSGEELTRGSEKSWDELRKRWDELSGGEKRWEELRRGGKRWEELDELRRVEKRWAEVRVAEGSWEELGTVEKSWAEVGIDELSKEIKKKRWSEKELRRAEKWWPQFKRGEARWGRIHRSRVEEMCCFTPVPLGKNCLSILYYNIPSCWKLPPPASCGKSSFHWTSLRRSSQAPRWTATRWITRWPLRKKRSLDQSSPSFPTTLKRSQQKWPMDTGRLSRDGARGKTHVGPKMAILDFRSS